MSTLSILKQARSLLGDNNPTDYWKEDWEINDAITIAVPQVELDYPQGYVVLVSGEESISPAPDETTKILIAYKTAIIIRKGAESKSTREGIYVKDGDTVIDTTKGASNSYKSLSDLEDEYKIMVDRLYIQSVETGGYRIDMYGFEVL